MIVVWIHALFLHTLMLQAQASPSPGVNPAPGRAAASVATPAAAQATTQAATPIAPPVLLLRNPRKTECGAKQFLISLTVRAAPFALQSASAHDASGPEDLAPQLLAIKRVFVDRLTGGETAAQMRDLGISSLQGSKLFILTENPDRADATLRGAAEDLIFTDAFSSSEGINARGSSGTSSGSGTSERYNGAGSGYDTRSSRNLSIGVGENESSNIKERKHEALATVRLVNKDGDVIWSTTQESTGAKFRGASADVAEKITRQLSIDVEKLRRPVPRN